MNIDPKSSLAGLPILEVRAFLRKHSDFGFVESVVLKAFGRDDGARLLQTLLGDGYVELQEQPHGRRYYLTLKAGALANASATKPFTRKAAEKALAGFVQRCHQVRKRDEFVFKVGTAWLFGSMLTGKPKVGDVDVAVRLVDKHPYDPNRGSILLEKAREAERQGRQFSSHWERLTYAHQCVYRYLKSRSRILKLHDHNDEVLEFCEKKVIYQDPDCEPPSSESE